MYIQNTRYTNMQVKVHDDRARVPTKDETQVGYDLVIIKKVKDMSGCIMYDTGISIKPPEGYYTEIVAKSTIVKHNTMMANGISIIDPTYRDTLKICLTKPVMLPASVCQLIIRPMPPNIHISKIT